MPNRPKITALILACLLVLPYASPAFAGTPSVSAYSAIVVDYYTGKVLYSKNRNAGVLPASTVKLLTAMVVLDSLSVSGKVRVSHKAALAPASKIHIRTGEYYTVGDLVKATVISSANDAATCLAEAVSGTELAFASRMNAKARALGCTRSNFSNATGLPDKNMFTTATDMSRIMKAAYQYPFIRKCLQSQYRTIYRPGGEKIRLKNHNKLLWENPIEIYGKTGYTKAARHCFACVAIYRDRKVMVLVFRSGSWKSDVRKLSQFGLNVSTALGGHSDKISKNKVRLSKGQVYQIQKALKRAGFNPGGIDGVFGKKTLDATIQFQKKQGLSPDGIIGPRTLDRLRQFM